MTVRGVLVFVLCLGTLKVWSQGVLYEKMDEAYCGKPLLNYFKMLSDKESVRVFYKNEWIDHIIIPESNDAPLLEVLDQLFYATGLSYVLMDQSTIVVIKDPTQTINRKRLLEEAISKSKKIESLQIGRKGSTSNKQQYSITGLIVDAKTRSPLSYATINSGESMSSSSANEKGYFELMLTSGPNVLQISYVDYEEKLLDIEVNDDGELLIELEEKSVILDEVVISAQSLLEMATSKLGQIELNMNELKRAPTFLGETDLVKQVQNLPGVTTVGEAAAGFNVRGGGVDQNLILYDGLPVFNSSHLFGFFSAFNTDGIQNVSFYRGGIPAEYGGRTSSVMDIKTKNGDLEKWNYKAGIGMITTNLMADGPIRKGKSSLAASFRSTYSNWLVNAVRTDYADLSNSKVFFYDGSLKYSHILNEKTNISLSTYSSKDAFNLMGDSTYQWSNLLGSIKVNHTFSTYLSAEFTLGSSAYGYKVNNEDDLTASELAFKINTTVLKAHFNLQKASHNLAFGGQMIYYSLNPGSLEPTTAISNVRNFALNKQYAFENAFYFSDELQYSDQLFVEAGLRLPMFVALGPAEISTYSFGLPREPSTMTGSLHYKPMQPIRAYFGLEPRISARYMTGRSSSLKFGYNRMYQYMHLVTNTTAVTPIDIWQPSGYYFEPQRADQISMGYFVDFKEKKYGASVELYYKHLHNIIDFKDGANLVLNKNLEADLLQGKGKAYGIETSLSKNSGRLTGTTNYTYSRAFRTIGEINATGSINGGLQYPASFDQPHIMNIAWNYGLSKRYFFTGSFTYHTGRPVTIPLSAFSLENTTVAYFSARNQYRIPDYHRLDIALVIEGNHKKKANKGTWVFSIYNVYGRRNPYTIFFQNTAIGVPRPYQLSIIGTVFPSISYNMKF